MIENGTYRGKFVGWDLDMTRGGSEVMVVHLELIDSGEQVSVQLHQSDKAKPYSDAKLAAMGWAGKGHPLEGLDKEVDVRISEETWEGKTRQKADIVTGGSLKIKPYNPMSSTQKNDFLKRLTGAKAAANGAPPKAIPKPFEPSESDDSSIPF